MPGEPNTAVGLTLRQTPCRSVRIFKKIKNFYADRFYVFRLCNKSASAYAYRHCAHTKTDTRTHARFGVRSIHV